MFFLKYVLKMCCNFWHLFLVSSQQFNNKTQIYRNGLCQNLTITYCLNKYLFYFSSILKSNLGIRFLSKCTARGMKCLNAFVWISEFPILLTYRSEGLLLEIYIGDKSNYRGDCVSLFYAQKIACNKSHADDPEYKSTSGIDAFQAEIHKSYLSIKRSPSSNFYGFNKCSLDPIPANSF